MRDPSLVSCATAPAPAATSFAVPAADSDPPRRLDPDRLGDHLDRLYRAALGLTGSREEAEDLVQEAYLRVLRKPRWLRGSDDLGYLLRTLRNLHISRHHARGRRVSTVGHDEVIEYVEDERAPTPHAVAVAGEVHAAIASLPPAHRDVIVVVDLVGLSYREAARVLEVPTGTIMSRLHRARAGLARALGDEWAAL